MMLRRLFVAALALLGLSPACFAAPQAMVAAANPLAVQAGVDSDVKKLHLYGSAAVVFHQGVVGTKGSG